MSAPDLAEARIGEYAAAAVRTITAPGAPSPVLLICEHAGKDVPAPWRNLGLTPEFLETHFAWDPGAARLTEALAEKMRATAVLATYSRLFLDLNRFPGDWDCCRPDMAGIPVPANLDIHDRERAQREKIARAPFDQAVALWLCSRPAVVSIHSFTPLVAGKKREPEIGVLWREECRMGPPVLKALREQGRFVIGNNEPYDWRVAEGYTLRRHGLDHGLPCLYLEIRNDLLDTPARIARVADALAPALLSALAPSGQDAPGDGKTESDLPKSKGSPAARGPLERRSQDSRNQKVQRADS
jgi:predicted N-formylglutamate amidohydrolase